MLAIFGIMPILNLLGPELSCFACWELPQPISPPTANTRESHGRRDMKHHLDDLISKPKLSSVRRLSAITGGFPGKTQARQYLVGHSYGHQEDADQQGPPARQHANHSLQKRCQGERAQKCAGQMA